MDATGSSIFLSILIRKTESSLRINFLHIETRMSIKSQAVNLARKMVNQSGWHIMRTYKIPQSNLNLLSLAIPALLCKQETAFFVQIGASDGRTNDPIFPLVTKYKLKGLCVEPLPDVFEKLKLNYKGVEGVAFENAALTSQDKDILLFRPINSSNSVDFSQKTSIKEDVVLRHGFSKKTIQQIQVKGISFPTLIEKHRISSIDILQVDTEGADYEIVKSVLETDLLPQIIHYESLHLNKTERESCRHLLKTEGYSIIETERDTLAVQNF